MTRSVWLSLLLALLTVFFLGLDGCGAPGAQPPSSYTLTATPLAPTSIAPGESAASILTVTPSTGPPKGLTGKIFLSCSSSPSGPSAPVCAFTENPIVISSAAQVTSTITVFASINTPLATYTITVTASDGSNAGPSNGDPELQLTVM